MRQNPCRHCSSSYEFKGKHYPSFSETFACCEYRKEHNLYLKSKRKYTTGSKISTMDELMDQTFIMFNGRTTHIEAVKSMPYRLILKFLAGGMFYKAIKRENE